MKICKLVQSVIFAALLPCATWSATLRVTVTDQAGTIIPNADVVAVCFSSMGPVGSDLQKTNGSGVATLTVNQNKFYQVAAVKAGYLPSARDQMMNWTASINIDATDVSKSIQLRHVTAGDSVKDISISVNHDSATTPSGNLLFLNLTNKGTFEQAGMGYYMNTSAVAETSLCTIYSVPTSNEDWPFQLDVYNPSIQRGGRVDAQNKPGAAASDMGSIDIASTGNCMAPPTRQIQSDEKLGPIAIEGRALNANTGAGIEGVNVNINEMSANSALNINTQTDQNGYFAFYNNTETDNTKKIFQPNHYYGVNFNKNGFAGTWISTTTPRTLTVPMTPVFGKIKGVINIKSGDITIPIPQASINAWGDGHNYGPAGSDDWNSPNASRNQGMSNASTQVNKGVFELSGLSSGRYTLNLWSQFSSQPIVFNNGADGQAAVDSMKWDTGGANWGDDLIVEIDTAAFGSTAYARVYQAASTSTLASSAYFNHTSSDVIINITKNPDGTNTISGTISFTGSSAEIDPSSVLIVANEMTNGGGNTQPKSGFTVLKAADKVSANVYNYRIAGLADATYNLMISAPWFGLKPNTNGPRTNENIKVSGSAAVTANISMAPAGVITGVLRLPNGTILTPKLDGMDMMNVNINANSNDTNCWGGAQVDKDGSFRLDGLLPGKYDLQTNGWGNSYTYATAYMKNVSVVAGSTATVEIPLRKGVRVHPKLSSELPADMKASLAQDPATGMQTGNLSIVYTPASTSLNAKNMDTIFQMGKGGSQDNTINFWGGSFQDVSLEPGAYNFYLVYEKQFPQFDTNYAKVIVGRAHNFVVDLSKQTDSYQQNGSTMSPPTSCQNIPLTILVGTNRLSGTYSGVNTIRDADMQVIASNFNNFISYVPRVTVMDLNGNIMATGMVTPTPDIIRQTGLDGSGSTTDPQAIKRIKGFMDKMTFGINYLPPLKQVKVVVTTPNYPPLLRTMSIPGTLNINMDNDAGAGAQITGALRNSNGQPVADAIIRIRGRLLDRTVKSQADGSYLIPGLAMGVYRLTVTAPGYAMAADKVVISNDNKVSNFTLTACAGSISGTVYSQQFPYPLIVSGAQVVAYDDTANGLDPAKELPIYEATTDNFGAYTISPVIEGHTYKVALVVPGKAVQVYSPSPTLPATAGSALAGIDFTYKSKPPKVDIIARPNADGSVTLQGESPKKLVSLSASYNTGTAYSDSASAPLAVTQIGDKTYSVTLADKTKAYAVRFTVNDGGATNTLDIVYDPKNLAQSIASIDTQAVASGDVVLDSQGNDTSGIYISPGSITLADGSVPQLTINKENRTGSAYTASMDGSAIGGDIYHINMDMNGSQQNEDKTMTLTLGYDPALVGDGTDSLSVRKYNDTTHAWDPILAIPMVDPISGTVSVEVPSIGSAASASAPKKMAAAQFDGSQYRLSALRAGSSSNQQGIFMVSKAPARLAFAGDNIEVFNVPNPFNLQDKTVKLNRGGSLGLMTTKGTVIRFAVPPSMGTGVKTRFRIYNIAGELVKELNANEMLAGGVDGGYYYYLDWDGCNSNSNKCASGVYLCVAEIGTQKKIIKMALIK